MQTGSSTDNPSPLHIFVLRPPTRRGLVGWWVDLTAPPLPPRDAFIAEQERIRKAELTSLSIPAVFFCLVALLFGSLATSAFVEAAAISAIGLSVAAVFNRRGWTRIAAHLVPVVMMGALVMALVQLGPGGTVSFALYAVLALPVLLSGFLANQRAPWMLMALALGIVLVHASFAPHEVFPVGATNVAAVGKVLDQDGWWGTIKWPAALIVFAALFSWLGALAVERALMRADQAEELAALRKEQWRQASEHAAAVTTLWEQERNRSGRDLAN